MKDWRYIPAVLLAMMVAALVLLSLAMTVPNENIVRNLLRSSSLHRDGNWLYFTPLEDSTKVVRTPLGDIECTMLAFGLGGNQTGFTNVFASVIEAPTAFDCNALEQRLAGDPKASFNYYRYWHGYAIFTRPLLNFFAYSTLRLISALGMLVLCVGAVLCFMRKGGVGAAFGLIFPLLFISAPFTTLCFAPVWAVVSVGVIAVAVSFTRQNSALKYINIFVLIGGLTSFVDLLTNPIATFCVPATALMWLKSLEERTDAQEGRFRFLFQVGAAWCVGYFGFWSLKFGLVFLQDGASPIREIIDVAIFRLHGPVGQSTLMLGSATAENFSAVGIPMIVISMAIVVAALIHPTPAILRSTVQNNSAMLAICPVPILWYEMFANHSYIHWIFTSWNSYLIFVPLTVMVFGSWPTPLIQQRRPG